MTVNVYRYAAYLIQTTGGWDRFSLRHGHQLPRWRACIISGFCFSGHIHLYGTGAQLLGSPLGKLICWPTIMCSTMVFGQIWGYCLKEFLPGDDGQVRVSRARWGVSDSGLCVRARRCVCVQSGDDDDDVYYHIRWRLKYSTSHDATDVTNVSLMQVANMVATAMLCAAIVTTSCAAVV